MHVKRAEVFKNQALNSSFSVLNLMITCCKKFKKIWFHIFSKLCKTHPSKYFVWLPPLCTLPMFYLKKYFSKLWKSIPYKFKKQFWACNQWCIKHLPKVFWCNLKSFVYSTSKRQSCSNKVFLWFRYWNFADLYLQRLFSNHKKLNISFIW